MFSDFPESLSDSNEIAILRQTFYNYKMKLHRAKLFFGLALIGIFLNGCVKTEKTNINSNASNNSNSAVSITVKDDIEELGKFIKLPLTPEEATYNELDLDDVNSTPVASKPNEKKLVAVLKFSDENADQIVANAEKYTPAAPADIDAESWFPPELIAKSQETGDSALKGVEYAANDFLQTPFVNGKLTRLNDTNYFVLELLSF